MKKCITVIAVLLCISLFSACSSLNSVMDDVTDQTYNAVQSDDKYINAVKTAYINGYDCTYENAFNSFFAYPAWKHFKSDTGTEVVEFTGECTYDNQDVKAKIQFQITSQDGDYITFDTTYLSFNNVNQSLLILGVLLTKVAEEAPQNTKSQTNEDISVEKTTSTLSIPKVSDFKYVKITDGDGETYRITWDSVKGAIGYEVEDIQYDTGSEAGPYKQINETSECKYEIGASIGVTAKIRVRAYSIDTSGIRLYSNWSEQKTVNICGGYIAEDLSDASLGEGIKYRVRNRYYDEASQIGAFEDFNNAVETANQNPGYCVFDMNGNILYDSSQSEQ